VLIIQLKGRIATLVQGRYCRSRNRINQRGDVPVPLQRLCIAAGADFPFAPDDDDASQTHPHAPLHMFDLPAWPNLLPPTWVQRFVDLSGAPSRSAIQARLAAALLVGLIVLGVVWYGVSLKISIVCGGTFSRGPAVP
jgi:hypothetical protein